MADSAANIPYKAVHMGFYQELSRYYDELFPVDTAEMAFITEQIAGRERLLDIGCGTGNKTVHCSEAVGHVHAFDQDEGMIARALSDNSRPNIRYEVLDMRDMARHFNGLGFDAALCLGNTLVHLDGPAGIAPFLAGLRSLLRPGGVCVIQILNYDRILDRHIRDLPPLESARASFSRQYRLEGGKLHFLTAVTVKASGNSYTNDVLLYPLRRSELERLLAEARFPAPSWYGNYQGAPLDESSFTAIAVCRG